MNAGGETTGLGLGFFIAKTLLERSGATLDFENRVFPDRGAVVKVRWGRTRFRAPARICRLLSQGPNALYFACVTETSGRQLRNRP